jgi:AraC family transcriptional regulator
VVKSPKRQSDESVAPAFSEIPAWRAVGEGWRHLHGSVRSEGASFEWHDFQAEEEFNWGGTFHPCCVEVCLNLDGEGRVSFNKQHTAFTPLTAGFYRRGRQPLRGARSGGQRHQFLTVEMSYDFLRRNLGQFIDSLHPLVAELVTGNSEESTVAPPLRLSSRHQQLLASLRQAPVMASARPIWYQAKALEVAAEFFFISPPKSELFCHRQQRLASERVEKVVALLRQNLAEPLTLEEIGRAIGCSPFHLSRTFSTEAGMTIPQYLRQLRMERAAELLRSGRFNVTEAALEVGYSSLSHFSQVFHETFGCCPGLYPARTPAQKTLLDGQEH